MEINEVLQQGFKRWMKTLGYAESTVSLSTSKIKDFFFYLKTNEIDSLEQISAETIQDYHKHLQTRKHKRKSGSLSSNYITGNINAIKRFNKYLQETGKPYFDITLKLDTEKATTKTILTKEEVQALYNECSNDILGIRDRAMLSIYYGCGLRRSEGIALNIEDVLLKEKRIYVRRTKNYLERYVPINEIVKNDLENYIYVAREKILSYKDIKQNAFFLSQRVSRLCGNAMIDRLHKLAAASKLSKETGLHTLRHSIATHLLQSGMELEEISRFLGHTSLENTQIYTHIIHEL